MSTRHSYASSACTPSLPRHCRLRSPYGIRRKKRSHAAGRPSASRQMRAPACGDDDFAAMSCAPQMPQRGARQCARRRRRDAVMRRRGTPVGHALAASFLARHEHKSGLSISFTMPACALVSQYADITPMISAGFTRSSFVGFSYNYAAMAGPFVFTMKAS